MQSGVCVDLAPAPGLRERAEPVALTAAVAWLFVLACLALWSLGPLVVGWRPAVVVTGSMLPTIRPGDVVVVDPGATGLHRGEIVLVRDASQPSGRVAHRVVEVKGNGDLVTKGDANPTADRAPRHPADVVGRVRLVVPAAGRLAMLRHGPTRGDLAWAGVAVLACLTLGVVRPAGR
ncbi:signal peptidase I [Kineosporia sp. A_224]|uniref:signal peptidase I n=1 Tax=Kineosporia sp. A_224 TaxID=1962180 RepID=UPI000B4A73E2|nr:signal peptidase I [Kineosporia sp. A_224]MBI4939706.1 signal peptidase I [Actinomycetota bacterium]